MVIPLWLYDYVFIQASDGRTDFGALAAFSVGIYHDDNSRPLRLIVAALVGCGLLTYLITEKRG